MTLRIGLTLLLMSVIHVIALDYVLPASYNIFFQHGGHGNRKLLETSLPEYDSSEESNFGSNEFGQDYSGFNNNPYPSFDFSSQQPQPGQFPQLQPGQFPQPGQLPPPGQAPQPQPNPLDPSGMGCGTPPASCPKSRYRSLDGSCNNLNQPIIGTPNTPYTRLLPPKYGDGVSTPTESVHHGSEMPGARLVSLMLYPDVPINDPKWTIVAMQYGQIITHDMSMIAGSTQTKPHQTQCCSANGQLLQNADIPEHCFPLLIPNNDPLYAKFNIKCMNFVRTITDRDRNCVSKQQPAEQLTAVNHYLDLSVVYGNTQALSNQLRTFQGGRLRTEQRRGKEWLPANSNKTGTCTIQTPDEPCYLAGDVRVNQNPQLTILQIILLREHNRVADALAHLNPHWNDETIFQEARRICIAEHQFISYYEWLPIFIGLQNSLKNKILFDTKSYVNDYDANVNPTILNEHATAAFRFFHSLIAGFLDLIPEHRHSYGNIRMSDWFNRPLVLEQDDNFDDLTRGMGTQPQLASDQHHDNEITQYLFRNMRQFGSDLKAIDIQRNRDHGLASYNNYRQFCGLPKAYHFQDFLDLIAPENVDKLASLYASVDDVDLTVGGSLERLVPGTLAGPTFLCILTEQFYRTRAGDRFWFENGHTGNPFTIEQLNEIRKSSISRLFCDNAHHVQSMQPRGFEVVSEHNRVVPCEALPAVDLSLWKDIGGGQQESHFYY